MEKTILKCLGLVCLTTFCSLLLLTGQVFIAAAIELVGFAVVFDKVDIIK